MSDNIPMIRLREALSRGVLLAGLLLAPAWGAAAADNYWKSVEPRKDEGSVCLAVQGQEFDYCILGADKPVVLSVRGPRRLKIVTRYLFGPDDPSAQSYTLRVLRDGREVLRKEIRSEVLAEAARCGGDGAVSSLRRSTLSVPTGVHEFQVFVDAPTGGRVAGRFFREMRRTKSSDVAFSPEGYEAVYHLQFDSGTRSTYYHFTDSVPLRFTVKGPTNLKVYTRLDFDHRMNGDQNYSLELLRDGKSQNVFHYHASKLSAVSIVERPDILPGSRKLLRIAVPKGIHRYEIRCVRPESCGISAQIRIPAADVKP